MLALQASKAAGRAVQPAKLAPPTSSRRPGSRPRSAIAASRADLVGKASLNCRSMNFGETLRTLPRLTASDRKYSSSIPKRQAWLMSVLSGGSMQARAGEVADVRRPASITPAGRSRSVPHLLHTRANAAPAEAFPALFSFCACGQSPRVAWRQGERGNGSGVGAQDARTKRDAQRVRPAETCACARPRRNRPRDRSAAPAGRAWQQPAPRLDCPAPCPRRRRPAAVLRLERRRGRFEGKFRPDLGKARMPYCSAASIAFAFSRSRLRRETRHDGQHRLEQAGTHLDGLLGQ